MTEEGVAYPEHGDQQLLEGVKVQVLSRHCVSVSRAQKLTEVGHQEEHLQQSKMNVLE